MDYLWSNVNSEQSSEEESSDSGIIGDYVTPSEYEPSEPRPRRRPEDDDVEYEPSDNEVCMHIDSNYLFIKLRYTLNSVLCVEQWPIPATTS
jgi:hypothetical protein